MHERDHRLGDDARSGHSTHVAALVDRLRGLTGCDVDGVECARHRRDGLHRGANAQHLPRRHATFGAAGAIGSPAHALSGVLDLVVRERAASPSRLEAVADLDALDRLDAHQRAGQARVEPPVPMHVTAKPRRQAVDTTLRRRRRGCRRPFELRRSRPPWRRWSRDRSNAPGRRRCGHGRPLPGTSPAGALTWPIDTTWLSTSTSKRLTQEAGGDLAKSNPRRGLASTCPFKNRAGRRSARISACRRGRRGRDEDVSAARCARDRRARLRRPGREP